MAAVVARRQVRTEMGVPAGVIMVHIVALRGAVTDQLQRLDPPHIHVEKVRKPPREPPSQVELGQDGGRARGHQLALRRVKRREE